MSNHVTILATAIATALKMLGDTRSMRQIDPRVRRFVQSFERNQELLQDKPFAALCAIFIRYLLEGREIPSTLAALSRLVKPLVLLALPGVPRHKAAQYEVCMLACCADGGQQLAATIARLVANLEIVCDTIASDRRVPARLVLIHANEASFDDVPSAEHADSMRGKRLSDRVTLEFFYASELQFNRLTSESVLPHVPLDLLLSNDAQYRVALREQLRRDKSDRWKTALKEPQNLQKLCTHDIIVRWHGFERGQIVRTERNDVMCGGQFFEYFQVV